MLISYLVLLCEFFWELSIFHFCRPLVDIYWHPLLNWILNIKLNFLSDRWLHHFVATLPLTEVPPYLSRFLALVNSTIRCENFSTKNVLPRSVGPTTRSENLCRNINSGCTLVSTETSLVNLGLLVILYNAEVFPFLWQLQQFVFVLYFPFACVILGETSGTLIVLYPVFSLIPKNCCF